MKRAADAGVAEAVYRRSAEVHRRPRHDRGPDPGRGRRQALRAAARSPRSRSRTTAATRSPPGAVLVKHLLYSPKDDPGAAAALAADDPAWKAAEDEAKKAYDELQAGTTRFVDLAPGSDDATLGRRQRLPAVLRQGRPADPAGPGLRRRDLRRRASSPASSWRRSSRPSAGTSSSSSRRRTRRSAPRS